MNEFDATYILDRLASQRAKLARCQETLETERARILKPVQKQIKAAEAEFDKLAVPILDKIDKLEDRARTAVLSLGQTVKNDAVEVKFVNGLVSWNSDMLTALAVEHPAINTAKKVGEPTTSITYAKPKKE